ncbi:TlpA disulfide reductase family protein [Flavobacterium hungaricum]|uniref:AhpC/TSA family protein n=1 Tax=Flavobacterium hungaricum TaxID=2082725 RepID=A0ABR9TDB0_9FLAO|nr:TlpA disulfide reductase family protein [Flavobacterium hungaricum]MBE8723343.1 AhpC/TSA family protein [Flavobacterium hungaricum]
MKNLKTNIFAFCACIMLTGFANAQAKKTVDTGYVLEGQIAGLEDGTNITLVPGATHSSEKAIAATKLKEGKFSFTGKLSEPRFFYIAFGDNKGFIPIMVENSKIKVTAAAEKPKEEGGRINFKDEKITGSKANDYFVKQTAFKEELNNDYAAYHVGIDKLSDIVGKARKENNKKIMDSVFNLEQWKKFEADEKAFFTKVEKLTTDVVIKHKTNWWGPFFMMTQFSYLTPDQKPLYEQFSDAAKKSYYGQLVDKEINPKSLVGTSVANFKLNDKDGNPKNVKDIVSGKKYILIDFWASWCGPCRKEIPNLKNAYAAYAEKGFEVVSISIDQDQKAWLKALGQENMQWPNLYDDDKVSKAFNVKTIPATYLVDSKGVIISDNLRGEALDAKLKELLKS